MLCYIMLYYVILCYIMLYYVMLYYIVLYCIVLYYVVLCISLYIILYNIIYHYISLCIMCCETQGLHACFHMSNVWHWQSPCTQAAPPPISFGFHAILEAGSAWHRALSSVHFYDCFGIIVTTVCSGS